MDVQSLWLLESQAKTSRQASDADKPPKTLRNGSELHHQTLHRTPAQRTGELILIIEIVIASVKGATATRVD